VEFARRYACAKGKTLVIVTMNAGLPGSRSSRQTALLTRNTCKSQFSAHRFVVAVAKQNSSRLLQFKHS